VISLPAARCGFPIRCKIMANDTSGNLTNTGAEFRFTSLSLIARNHELT